MVYEENEKTIQEEVEEDTELKEMIQESRKEYKEGKYKTTGEIIDKISGNTKSSESLDALLVI